MSTGGILEVARAEDFVEYFLFPILHSSELKDINEQLNTNLKSINNIVEKYCKNYIWHKDEFRLTVRGCDETNAGNSIKLLNVDLAADDEQNDLPPHIYGISFYGDNIEDEWFIVSLLFEISKQFPDIIIRVIDSDGEFMLIEASECLPDWANPDTCEQRVYISDCSVHLVQNSPSNTSTILPVSLAISKIRNNPGLYKVTADIERCIEKRIKKFPININELQCKRTVFLPIAAAALLKHKPSLIAAAVRAFYNRDSIDMKVCRVMKYFPPENRVFTQITFTKCLYAMLMNTKYQPDRRIGWNLPPTTDQLYKAHSLGIKIACGFEILASQAQHQQQTQHDDGDDVDSIENSKEWHRFLTTLRENGYFQKFLEFSQDYNRLLNSAKEYFKENFQFSYGREIGKEILMELKKIDYTNEDFKLDEQSLPVDDDDDWLHITPEDLDNMLRARYGITKIINSNDNINNNEANELTENITNFLNKKSDIDGIECNNNSFDLISNRPIPPKRTKKVNKNNTVKIIYNDNNNNNKEIDNSDDGADNLNVQDTKNGDDKLRKHPQQNLIDFNPDAFQNHVKDMLDLVIPEDKWESNSDISDFGGDESDLEKNMNEDMNDDNINVKKTKIKTSLKSYMDQMDRELAKTTIGESFEKQKLSDRHLHNCDGSTVDGDDDFDDIETFKPVDIDMNTLKHMANSYQSQFGGPGPVSNLLGTMGMKLTSKSNDNDIDIKNYNTQV